nr:YggT family protein [Pedobacter sp. Leaf250]
MILAFRILINVLIVGLFLYSKLLPYKDKLNSKYKSAFNFFQGIFQPVLNFLQTIIKPFQVGQGLAVDMTQIVLLIVLLLLNNYF